MCHQHNRWSTAWFGIQFTGSWLSFAKRERFLHCVVLVAETLQVRFLGGYFVCCAHYTYRGCMKQLCIVCSSSCVLRYFSAPRIFGAALVLSNERWTIAADDLHGRCLSCVWRNDEPQTSVSTSCSCSHIRVACNIWCKLVSVNFGEAFWYWLLTLVKLQQPGVHHLAERESQRISNFLFELCSKYELQQLHASLPTSSKAMLKTLHTTFEQQHKFTGKT